MWLVEKGMTMKYFYSGTTAETPTGHIKFCGIWTPDKEDDGPVEILEGILNFKRDELGKKDIVLTSLNGLPKEMESNGMPKSPLDTLPEKKLLKFTNAVEVVENCYENMDNTNLGDTETESREEFISWCQAVADGYACELDE